MRDYMKEAIARDYRKAYKKIAGKPIAGKAELLVIDLFAYREATLRNGLGLPPRRKSFEKRLKRFKNRKH